MKRYENRKFQDVSLYFKGFRAGKMATSLTMKLKVTLIVTFWHKTVIDFYHKIKDFYLLKNEAYNHTFPHKIR